MFTCECFYWSRVNDGLEYDSSEPQPFSLPSPLPRWPQGKGFATGNINLGEIEVVKITKFERIWSCDSSGKSKCTFFKPVGVPEGFFCLGHYCQPNNQPLRGFVLAARPINLEVSHNSANIQGDIPVLKKPLNYSLVWSAESPRNGCGYFWLPNPPVGYKAMGVIVTTEPDEPNPEEVRCVREDLTESCETYDLILGVDSSKTDKCPFRVWSTRPCERGMWGQGVSVGTFFCSTYDLCSKSTLEVSCLKNLVLTLPAMPNLDQVHALIQSYGPTVFFHPDEAYMPSSVQWFFKNGALLYRHGKSTCERINYEGSNLPAGGENDGEFWIDLPEDDEKRNNLKKGSLESAELYVHLKPALGGTFTDITMWVFCPFNGPAALKLGLVSVSMNRVGEHVGDWEHFTLRISNFTGELWEVYFSQHSGGQWVDASGLEFIEGNKPAVYSSKHGHASFPHPGMYLIGSTKLGVGVRNDVAKSKFLVDSSQKYKIVAAEYLGKGAIGEPCWLQYMREWGPTVVYDSRSEINKIMDLLPLFIRFSVENILDLFPIALYGEEGPTGPKEKDNWVGDERC